VTSRNPTCLALDAGSLGGFGVDSEYTIQGLIATGSKKTLVYASYRIDSFPFGKENGNGSDPFMSTLNVLVFQVAVILTERPQWLHMGSLSLDWRSGISKNLFSRNQKGELALAEKRKDGKSLPDGYGMMELHAWNLVIEWLLTVKRRFADACSDG